MEKSNECCQEPDDLKQKKLFHTIFKCHNCGAAVFADYKMIYLFIAVFCSGLFLKEFIWTINNASSNPIWRYSVAIVIVLLANLVFRRLNRRE